MEKAKKPRVKFYVDKKGKLVHDAVIFMILSVIFRLIGCWGAWTDRSFTLTQIVLPLLAGGLFVLCLRFLGDRLLWTSCIAAVPGAVFFVLRALSFVNWINTALGIACTLLAALVYIATVLGFIRRKWFLPPLFILPFLYHAAVVDVAALRQTADPVLFSEGMVELSVLCTLLSLSFGSLAIKRRKGIEDMSLPKIKDPVVIVPKPQDAATSAVDKPEGTPAVSAPSDIQPDQPAAPSDMQPSPDTAVEAPQSENVAEPVPGEENG